MSFKILLVIALFAPLLLIAAGAIVNQEMAILQNRRERALRRERGIDASYVANGACLA